MASGSGQDQDAPSQEPVDGHGQREGSNVATYSPSAVAAEGGADASSPPPLPAAPSDPPQEFVRDPRKGKLPAIEECPPRSAGSSTSTTSLDGAGTAEGGADASLPSPLPAAPVGRPQEHAPEQAGSGSGRTHGSSSAAAVLDQMVKGLPTIQESSPRSAGSSASTTSRDGARTVEQGGSSHPKKGFLRRLKKFFTPKKKGESSHSHPKKGLFRKLKKIFTGKKKVVEEEIQTYSEHVHRQVGEEGRETDCEHVHRQTLPITEVRNHYPDPEAMPIQLNLGAFSRIRRVLGDGECFYRSFIFSYLEQVLDRQDSDEEARLIRIMQRVLADTNFGLTDEFFSSYGAFAGLINKLNVWKNESRGDDIASANSYRKEKLLEFFSTYDTTNAIFAFLRYLVAIEICSPSGPDGEHPYGERITLPENYTLKDWCLEHVTKAREDADHVTMVALAAALEVRLRVERLYGGGTDEDNIYTGPGDVRVTLLYTGNHYDIIYPGAPSAESSSTQASQGEHPAGESSSQQQIVLR